MNNIGEKIRIQRLTKNYSQEYMAFMLDLSQAAYSNLERNATELTIKRIYDIAEILEVSPFDLMPKPKFGSGMDLLLLRRVVDKILYFLGSKKRRTATPAPML